MSAGYDAPRSSGAGACGGESRCSPCPDLQSLPEALSMFIPRPLRPPMTAGRSQHTDPSFRSLVTSRRMRPHQHKTAVTRSERSRGTLRKSMRGPKQAYIRREERGGTRKFVYQKWPDQIFVIVVFSHDDHFGLERGGGGARPMVAGRSNVSLVPKGRVAVAALQLHCAAPRLQHQVFAYCLSTNTPTPSSCRNERGPRLRSGGTTVR